MNMFFGDEHGFEYGYTDNLTAQILFAHSTYTLYDGRDPVRIW